MYSLFLDHTFYRFDVATLNVYKYCWIKISESDSEKEKLAKRG